MSSGKGYYERYSLDELITKDNPYRTNIEEARVKQSIEEALEATDDNLKSKTWTKAYEIAAFYYDNPDYSDRFSTLNKFRYHFAGLLSKTESPTELPNLTNRSSFVEWVCKKHNEFLTVNNANVKVDCDVQTLLDTYGPNYHDVKKTLGYQDFYI